MPQYPHQKPLNGETQILQFDEFLTPEQRMEAASVILAAITLRILKKRHDNYDHSSQI